MFGRAVVAVLLAAVVLGVAPAAGAPRKTTVAASFYPLAWAARQVGGGAVRVRDLTPPGAEPHDLELTTDHRDAIEDADVVVVLGGGFQPAIEEAAAQRDGRTLVVADELEPRDRRRLRRDPHLWLDPVMMAEVLRTVDRVLPGDGGRRAGLALGSLDEEYVQGLGACARDLVVTAHESFGWLARRYGLRQEGVAGVDPEHEPSAGRVAELADLVQEEGVTTIFTEELVSPKVARTLAREAGGIRTEVLSTLESLTREQRARGDDYLDAMRGNLEKLRAALGCS